MSAGEPLLPGLLVLMMRISPAAIQVSAARPEGLEPPTVGSEDRCSIQLSYGRRAELLYHPPASNGNGTWVGVALWDFGTRRLQCR